MSLSNVNSSDGTLEVFNSGHANFQLALKKKDEQIAIKDAENKQLMMSLQEANQKLIALAEDLVVSNKNLAKAYQHAEKTIIMMNDARKETADLANRIADIAKDVITKPSDPQLLHSLTVCAMGGDQYAFLRPQRRSLKRSLGRLSVDSKDIVYKSDYVPNAVNVLNKVKENLPKKKYKARHNKITLLEDLTKEQLVKAIESSLTERQVEIVKNKAMQ